MGKEMMRRVVTAHFLSSVSLKSICVPFGMGTEHTTMCTTMASHHVFMDTFAVHICMHAQQTSPSL